MPTTLGRAAAMAGAATLGAAAVAAPVVMSASPAGADVPVVIVDGKGFGHGVGMAQDGAYEMARRGFSLSQILGQFYPGTAFGTVRGPVRVPVLGAGTAPTSAVVRFPNGGDVRDALSGQQSPGFPVRVAPGGEATIGWDGNRFTVTTGGVTTAAETQAQLAPTPTLPGVPTPTPASTTTTTRPAGSPGPGAPPAPVPGSPAPGSPPPGGSPAPGGSGGGGGQPGPSTTAPPASSASSSRPLWAVPANGASIDVPGRQRAYRGVVEAEGSTGSLRLVNQVDVETYLTGMGEVPGSWPAAAVQAQEVAARTYAMRAMASAGEICDDTRCQVYLGVGGESAGAVQAVRATAGQALFASGSLADTVYSANAAGYSATREEGFGVADGGYPYLRAAPYPAGDLAPYEVHLSVTDVAARLGVQGPIDTIAITRRGPSGRALELTIGGGGRQVKVGGLAFAAALGLRSSMIEVHLGADAVAPPPPPAASALQLLPEQVAEVARTAPDATTDAGATDPVAAAPPALRPLHHRHRQSGVALAAVVAGVLVAVAAAAAARLGGWSRLTAVLARRVR